MLCCSAVTLLVAIAFGVLWASLPTLISRAVNSDRNTTNVERLRLAHQMAGGLTDPQTADKSIADAIKALAEFAVPARSKPLFLFIKGGKEVARMDGANPIELEKLVTANATKRQ